MSIAATLERSRGVLHMLDRLRPKQALLPVFVVLTLGVTSAQAATWYASASNSTPPPSGTSCTSAAPCTFSYANGTKLAAGDTLLLYPGNYTDQSVTISKNNVTISAIASVVNALTFDKGQVVGGTDNRPMFLGTGLPEFTVSGSGVTL